MIKNIKVSNLQCTPQLKNSNQVRERERARKSEDERERERERELEIKNWQERCFHIVINREEFKTKALLSWCQNRKLSSLDQPKRRKKAPAENEEKEHQNRTPHVRRRKKNNQIWAEKEKKIQYYNATRGVYASQYETSKGPRTTLTLTRAIFANVHELSYKSAIKTGSKSQFVIAWATTKATKNSDRKL